MCNVPREGIVSSAGDRAGAGGGACDRAVSIAHIVPEDGIGVPVVGVGAEGGGGARLLGVTSECKIEVPCLATGETFNASKMLIGHDTEESGMNI